MGGKIKEVIRRPPWQGGEGGTGEAICEGLWGGDEGTWEEKKESSGEESNGKREESDEGQEGDEGDRGRWGGWGREGYGYGGRRI